MPNDTEEIDEGKKRPKSKAEENPKKAKKVFGDIMLDPPKNYLFCNESKRFSPP